MRLLGLSLRMLIIQLKPLICLAKGLILIFFIKHGWTYGVWMLVQKFVIFYGVCAPPHFRFEACFTTAIYLMILAVHGVCGSSETQQHAIFECPKVRDLWFESGCKTVRQLASLPSMCEVIKAWSACDKALVAKGAFLAWVVWGERNNHVFNSVSTPHHVLLARVMRLVKEHGAYH